MFEKLLVAVNGSACAQQALDLAISLARQDGAALAICCVVDPIPAMWASSSGPTAERAIERAEEDACAAAGDAIAKAEAFGLAVRRFVREGDAASEIVACASECGADAIVMGTHGWTGIKRAMMGSVAEAVLHSAPCPVIVVRERAQIPVVEEASGMAAKIAGGASRSGTP